MATWSAFGVSGNAVLVTALGAALGVSAFFGSVALRDSAEPPRQGDDPVVSQIDDGGTTGALSDAPDKAPPTVPLFALDVVRIDSAGNAVFAGLAAPSSRIVFEIDGGLVFETTANRQGDFAALFSLDPSSSARILVISLKNQSGDLLSEVERILIAPSATVLAEAAPVVPEMTLDAAKSKQDLSAHQDIFDDGVVAPIASAETAQETFLPTNSDEVGLDVEFTVVAQEAVFGPEALVGADDTNGVVEEQQGQVETVPPERIRRAPTLVSLGADGNSVLQQSTVTPDARLNLDVISYGAQGEVIFDGGGAVGRKIQVYLDDRPFGSSTTVEANGWRLVFPDIDTGVYELRIEEYDPSGNVTAQLTTPFERVDPRVALEIFEGNSGDVVLITVQPGSTLWGIAQEQMGEGLKYVQVFEANQEIIRDPDLIFPGQVFQIPSEQSVRLEGD